MNQRHGASLCRNLRLVGRAIRFAPILALWLGTSLFATICPPATDPNPKHPYGIGVWRLKTGVQSSALMGEPDELTFARRVAAEYAAGLYLIDLEIAVVDGTRYRTGIFSTAGSGRQVYFDELERSQLTSQNALLARYGYTVVDVDTYVVNGARKFAAVWQQTRQLGILRTAMSECQLQCAIDAYEALGLIIQDLISWQEPTGQVLFTANFLPGTQSRLVVTGLDWSDFLGDFTYYNANNLRLVDIDHRVEAGTTFYTAIFELSSEATYFLMGNCYEDVEQLRETVRGNYHLVDYEWVIDDVQLLQGEGGHTCSEQFPWPPTASDEITYCQDPGSTSSGVVQIPQGPQVPDPEED